MKPSKVIDFCIDTNINTLYFSAHTIHSKTTKLHSALLILTSEDIPLSAKKRILCEAFAVALCLCIALFPAPEGLEQNAMWVLGLLVWAIVNWVGKTIPDFAAILIMCCGWVVLKIVPFPVAFGAFSGSATWLLIGALGIGVAVTKSGLLSRLSLHIMRSFPATFRGQVMAMLSAGVLVGPFIPATTAKVAIAGAMSTAIGEKLGFADRSQGMVGMWAAMYTGFCLTAPMILSASFFGYMLLALLPEATQQQFTFANWFLAMIPWGIIVVVGSYFAIIALYRPETSTTISREDIEAMMRELGPMKRDEVLTLLVLVLCIVCWMLEKTIEVPSVVPAVVGMAVLLGFNVISAMDFNTRISWSLVMFVGGAINLATALTTVHIDKWIGDAFGPVMASLTLSPYLFVTVVAVVVTLTRLVIVDHMTCFTLYTVILTPFCLNAGMSPWIVSTCCYVVIQPWFVKYQNVNFLAGYSAAGGDDRIGHPNTVKYAFSFTAISILGLLASVPYWKMLGLLQ